MAREKIESEVTHDQVLDAEGRILESYGLSPGDAQDLIADIREAGGLDRFLRERARADGISELYRVDDPEEEA